MSNPDILLHKKHRIAFEEIIRQEAHKFVTRDTKKKVIYWMNKIMIKQITQKQLKKQKNLITTQRIKSPWEFFIKKRGKLLKTIMSN